MDDLPPPFGHDLTARQHVCEHCADTYTAARSDQRFCSDRCRLRNWRSRKQVRSAQAIEAEHVTALLAEVDRLQHQVTELQRANATLREALNRAQTRLISARSPYRRRG
jgi:predicted nucleic acid-binding Zn ribbon protein